MNNNKIELSKTITKRISGIQFTGDNHIEIMRWLGEKASVMYNYYPDSSISAEVYIPESKSWHNVKVGDWIIAAGDSFPALVLADKAVQALFDEGWVEAPVS